MSVDAYLRRGICALLLLTASIPRTGAASYDLIIRDGHIIDGTGSPWYAGDVAVKDGRIAAIYLFFDKMI